MVHQNLKIELPREPTISHLSLYPDELKAGNRTNVYIQCSYTMSTAVLFTIAKGGNSLSIYWMNA